MGSSGSGSFTDYSKQKPKPVGGKSGGSSGDDKCGKAFNTSLEEVSRCHYFVSNGKVPPKGTEIKIVFLGHFLDQFRATFFLKAFQQNLF